MCPLYAYMTSTQYTQRHNSGCMVLPKQLHTLKIKSPKPKPSSNLRPCFLGPLGPRQVDEVKLRRRHRFRRLIGGGSYHLETQGADRVGTATVGVHVRARGGSAQCSALQEASEVFGTGDLYNSNMFIFEDPKARGTGHNKSSVPQGGS